MDNTTHIPNLVEEDEKNKERFEEVNSQQTYAADEEPSDNEARHSTRSSTCSIQGTTGRTCYLLSWVPHMPHLPTVTLER